MTLTGSHYITATVFINVLAITKAINFKIDRDAFIFIHVTGNSADRFLALHLKSDAVESAASFILLHEMNSLSFVNIN